MLKNEKNLLPRVLFFGFDRIPTKLCDRIECQVTRMREERFFHNKKERNDVHFESSTRFAQLPPSQLRRE